MVTVLPILLQQFLPAGQSKALSSSTAMVPAASIRLFIMKLHNRHSTSPLLTSTMMVTVMSLRSRTPQRQSPFMKILAMAHSRVLPRYEVASLSDAVESADIDNDGDIDIVVNGEFDISSLDPLVKILKNNGNGTFAPAIDYTPTRNFADMKLRDINGDGFVDLIFAPDANDPPYHFGTALNLSNGTFAPTVVTEVFSCGDGTIDAADLDGDGDLDIVLTEEETCPGINARIFIFRNDGNQNFVRMPDIDLPGRLPHGLALADVTGDGHVDIITALPDLVWVYSRATETLRLEPRSSVPLPPSNLRWPTLTGTACSI